MDYIINLLFTIPILLVSLTLHELSHGWAAYLMGDTTAKGRGRLSLNPFKHVDWLGFLMLVVAGIGWAKPVPINAMRFKEPKKGVAITALAGPLMNVLLVFISLLLWGLGHVHGFNAYVMQALYIMSYYNAVLAMFNFLPIPPLDGSKVLFAFLPSRYYFKIMIYEHYGMILILILSFTNMTSKIISVGVDNLINRLWQLVVSLLTLLGV